MRPLCIRSAITLLLLLYILTPARAQTQVQEISPGSGFNYLLFHPREDQNLPLPLLVFLHGIGEKGNNLEAVKRHGPPKLISNGTWPTHLPFIVVSPQLPAKYKDWPPDKVDQLISDIIEKYKVAEDRIYLTGLSLGGIGTWKYATTYPERAAAVLPVCGYGNPENACRMQKVPVWAFHGENDPVVKAGGSVRMIRALQNCPGADTNQIKLTLYPGTGHNAWAKTYKDPDTYRWLLSHTRKGNEKNSTGK